MCVSERECDSVSTDRESENVFERERDSDKDEEGDSVADSESEIDFVGMRELVIDSETDFVPVPLCDSEGDCEIE